MDVWNVILLKPILNFLIVLYSVLFSNFGLAIIALTIIVRLVILPLSIKQLRSSRAMTEKMRDIQPKLQQIQKKYAKDRAKLQQEQMRLYKEAGINPLGCLASPMLLTMVIQLPIFVALYQSIIRAMAVTPQDFHGLSDKLYSWPIVHQALPASGEFLWLNLGKPDHYLLIPLLVMGSTWISQKMMAQPPSDPRQQSMQGMMQLMMPLMFGLITFTLPSGLGLYFLVTTIFGIVTQYYIFGWGNLFARAPAQTTEKQTTEKKIPQQSEAKIRKHKEDVIVSEKRSNRRLKEGARHGKFRGKRKDRRRSRPDGSRGDGSQ